MLEWDGFRYFLAVYRGKTLKSAAQSLSVDQTTVGRRIAALEATLGTQLFEKRSDGYFLTLAGERVLPTVEAAEDSVFSIERVIAGREERVEGLVRIAMPGALTNHWLIPRLKGLMQKYPGLELEFLTGPEVVNLSKREADLAIRLVKPTQQNLVARKFGRLELAVFGHASLWAGKGKKKPSKKEELEKFPFVGLVPNATSDLEASLLEKLQPHLRYQIRSAAWSSVFAAVQSGLGIGILPMFMTEGKSELTRIDVIDSVSMPLWLVAHPDIIRSARVRVVLDFISELSESTKLFD